MWVCIKGNEADDAVAELLHVRFSQPVRAITSGQVPALVLVQRTSTVHVCVCTRRVRQAFVLYEGEVCLGGSWIRNRGKQHIDATWRVDAKPAMTATAVRSPVS